MIVAENIRGIHLKNFLANCCSIYGRKVCSGVSSDGGEIRETKRTNDSQVPQGSGLLSKLLQRSCQVGRVGERSERFRVVQQ